MPNPRVTFRCPIDLYEQLPKDERERSQLIIELLQRHCNPADLEDEVARLKARVEVLERKMNLT